MEFSRPEYWSGWPFPSPGDLPNPGIEPRSPALHTDSLPVEPQGKPKNTGVGSLSLLQQIFLTQESTFSGAFAAMSQSSENAVLVATGTYSGPGNRSLAVSGKDVKILFDGTGARPVIDLEDSGRFLSASYETSFKASGLVFRNGRSDSRGTALDFSDSEVTLVN